MEFLEKTQINFPKTSMGLDDTPESERHWVMASLALITGLIGSGKTTICSSLYGILLDSGYPVSGLVQKTERNEYGFPTRIGFHDLSTGKYWPWAERESGFPTPPPFVFPEQPLALAIACLSRAAEEGKRPIILDEIGLLEIESGIGFLGWVLGYLGRDDACLIASLRKGRAESFLKIIADASPRGKQLESSVFGIEGENGDSYLRSALDWTLRHCPKQGGNVYL